jgi:hypothetical protein
MKMGCLLGASFFCRVGFLLSLHRYQLVAPEGCRIKNLGHKTRKQAS